MRCLLDINVLIAFLDPKHTFHKRVRAWWHSENEPKWASCPLTENGVVRIMANPNYDTASSFSVTQVIGLLEALCIRTDHVFWPDSVSLLDPSRFDRPYFLGPKRLTDIYLLALATENNGCLVTLDKGISISAVKNAKPQNLILL